MKSISKIFCLSALFVLLCSPAALAHEIWAWAENPQEGQPMTAVLGYGHDFPNGEDISPERLSIFFPIKVVGAKGEMAVKPGTKNYLAVTEQPLEKGSYMVLTGYKPTFWSSGPEGSVMKPKNEVPGAVSCERYSRAAKGIINVGGAVDDFVTKPVGTKLEIVPLVNPGTLKTGQAFPVQVLLEGKPLPAAAVKATFAGYPYYEEGNRAFFGLTDKDGKVNIVPHKSGVWTAAVEIKKPFHDLAVCDDEAGDATLTFSIAD